MQADIVSHTKESSLINVKHQSQGGYGSTQEIDSLRSLRTD